MYAYDTSIYFNLEDFPVHNRSMLINNDLERVNEALWCWHIITSLPLPRYVVRDD